MHGGTRSDHGGDRLVELIDAGFRSGANLVPENPVGTIEFADYVAAAE